MLTDPPRRTREAQIHALGERFCAVGHADGEALAALWPEAVGMRCERHAAMVTEGKERWQPARVWSSWPWESTICVMRVRSTPSFAAFCTNASE